MILPPLPARNIDHTFDWSYTEQQMREYGALCRKQAIEEAIDAIETANARKSIYVYDCVDILREMI